MTLSREELERLIAGATPLPWRMEDGANSHCFDHRIIAGENDADCIAFVDGDSRAGQLMLAAPELAAQCLAQMDEIEALRKQVAEMDEALEREREACARLCDGFDGPVTNSDFVNGQATAAQQIRAAIRARAARGKE